MGQIKAESQHITFTKNLFVTNRTLENVFFEQREEVTNRVNFFINRKDWYDKKGIPWTLGLMLHGTPGTGKTSAIKAIANITHRHVININLGKIKTKKELKQLFYDDRIQVSESSEIGPSQQFYIIPIVQRLYVIEDIDCLNGDVLKKRDSESGEPSKQKPPTPPGSLSTSVFQAQQQQEFQDMMVMPNNMDDMGTLYSEAGSTSSAGGFHSSMFTVGPSRTLSTYPVPPTQLSPNKPKTPEEEEQESDLDLSSILNIMDGTLETPGRIIIITSNYPEKLDHAFIRPGRIDMIIEFKKANRTVIKDMFKSFYDRDVNDEQLQRIDDYKWTPAEVSQILFKYFNDPDMSLKDLAEHDPKDYFKFSYMDQSKRNSFVDNHATSNNK